MLSTDFYRDAHTDAIHQGLERRRGIRAFVDILRDRLNINPLSKEMSDRYSVSVFLSLAFSASVVPLCWSDAIATSENLQPRVSNGSPAN
jgi:hypothetical protein